MYTNHCLPDRNDVGCLVPQPTSHAMPKKTSSLLAATTKSHSFAGETMQKRQRIKKNNGKWRKIHNEIMASFILLAALVRAGCMQKIKMCNVVADGSRNTLHRPTALRFIVPFRIFHILMVRASHSTSVCSGCHSTSFARRKMIEE